MNEQETETEVAVLQPGTLVKERYEVVKRLGQGSKGTVYLCRDNQLAGRFVVLKVLFHHALQDEVETARFRDEIIASYDINHPFVVRADQFIRDEIMMAITMEYINGGDLADMLSTGEPIPIEQIRRVLTQICSGVQAIHDAGIIHRDLKPENILLTADGDVKITDFGISRIEAVPRNTRHNGALVGTIHYLSPEYVEKSEFDNRSDIYSIGVIAYEMITGTIPFIDDTVFKTLQNRLLYDPEPVHKLRRDCPLQISAIVHKAMQRDPGARYQSAEEMLNDLAAYDLSLSLNEESGTQQSKQPPTLYQLPVPPKAFEPQGGDGLPDNNRDPLSSIISQADGPSTRLPPYKRLARESRKGPGMFSIVFIWLLAGAAGIVALSLFLSSQSGEQVDMMSIVDYFRPTEVDDFQYLKDNLDTSLERRPDRPNESLEEFQPEPPKGHRTFVPSSNDSEIPPGHRVIEPITK